MLYLQTLERTIFFYFLIAFIIRFLGKKEIAQLTIFDFVIILMIADISAITIEQVDTSYWPFACTLLTLMLLQKIISYINLNCFRIRRFLDGSRSIIVFKGKLHIKNMRKNLYTVSDLIMEMRNNKIKCISDISLAVLEINGKLSIFKYDANEQIALPVIISGCIINENLKYLKLDKAFVEKKIEEKKLNLKDINYAAYKNNDLWIPEQIE